MYVSPLRVEDADGDLLAVGAALPCGELIIEWNRDAYEPEERTDNPVVSRYGSVPDAEQATGGTVRFGGAE